MAEGENNKASVISKKGWNEYELLLVGSWKGNSLLLTKHQLENVVGRRVTLAFTNRNPQRSLYSNTPNKVQMKRMTPREEKISGTASTKQPVLRVYKQTCVREPQQTYWTARVEGRGLKNSM